MKKDEFKYHFSASGGSDDYGSITGGYFKSGKAVDEYTAVNNWFELKLNGEVIGECMMEYDGGWNFSVRSNTHKLEAGVIIKDCFGEPFTSYEPGENGTCLICNRVKDEHTHGDVCEFDD